MIDVLEKEVMGMNDPESIIREALRQIREDAGLGYIDKLIAMREVYEGWKATEGGEKTCENSFSTT